VAITVFAGTPCYSALSGFGERLHQMWDLGDDPVAARRAEDERALAVVGAAHVHLQYLDCIYRRVPGVGDWLYPTRDDVFGGIHPGDAHLVEDFLVELGGFLPSPEECTLYAPLGVGHHVDHQIVRGAGHALCQSGYDVRFFEDYPYSAMAGKLDEALRGRPDEGWEAYLEELSPEDLAAKTRAIEQYASQLDMLFGRSAEAEQAIREFAALLSAEGGHAERYWRPSQTGSE